MSKDFKITVKNAKGSETTINGHNCTGKKKSFWEKIGIVKSSEEKIECEDFTTTTSTKS